MRDFADTIDSATRSRDRFGGGFDDKAPIEREPHLIRASDVSPENVQFLWNPYIPLGKLTLLEGDPGVGKTWIGLALSACVSRGDGFPNSSDGSAKAGTQAPRNVIYLSAEDGLADTLRKRLDALRAEARNVYFLPDFLKTIDGETTEMPITLSDIDVLNKALTQIQPILVVIDPLQAYLGAEVDLHRANETRPVLARLARLAERHSCAIVLIRHLSKSTQTRALYRGLGSIDLTAAARSVLLVGSDPKDSEKRAIVHLKSSLAKAGPTIAYSLSEGQLQWQGLSTLRVEDLLASDVSRDDCSAVDDAKQCIIGCLRDGSKTAGELKQYAVTQDISAITYRRARAALHREGRISREGGGAAGPVSWSLCEWPQNLTSGDRVSSPHYETES